MVAGEIYEEVKKNYGLELNKNRLLWGSIAPDYLPYYKIKSHYKKDSLDFIVREIVSLILVYRFVDLDNMNKTMLNFLSRKIGVISHYMCDFTCRPHMLNQSFKNNMKEHMDYEKRLNEFSKYFVPKRIEIISESNNYDVEDNNLMAEIKSKIEHVINVYAGKVPGYDVDLNFGLTLSMAIMDIIMENVSVVSDRAYATI